MRRASFLPLVFALSSCLLKTDPAVLDDMAMVEPPLDADGGAPPDLPIACSYTRSTASVSFKTFGLDYDLVQPNPRIAGMRYPIVIALHHDIPGDVDTADVLRTGLKMEGQTECAKMAIFVYPKIDYHLVHMQDTAENIPEDRPLQVNLWANLGSGSLPMV